MAELAAIESQIESVKREKEGMSAADRDFPNWAQKVYNPTIKNLISALKIEDDAILAIYDRLMPEIKAVQDTAISINKKIILGNTTVSEAQENAKRLEAVRHQACFTYNFQPHYTKGIQILAQIKTKNDELMDWANRLGNIHFIKHTAEQRIVFDEKVRLTKVTPDLLDESLPRKVCAHYRKMIALNAFVLSLAENSALRSDIKQLIAQIDAALLQFDPYDKGTKFQADIRNSAANFSTALLNARSNSQWNKGTRLALDAAKILYLVMIPSIEISQNILPEFKPILIEEITKTMKIGIKGWNAYANLNGSRNIINFRRVRINKISADIAAHIAATNDAGAVSALQTEFAKQLKIAPVQLEGVTFRINSLPTADENLADFDDKLSAVENLLNQFLQEKFGVKK